ncbi:aspartate aminotransferase [Arthrobacter sp. CAN_A212]|uniref:aminotransferase class I/II-fold pyridoxal phosphate-dependent enzyme n=1 Tax=Arthrobacter sp. CAN_C5 TaxID=2760706 RepID=UPI0018C8E8AA|nr:aminotransferase class I/II-fold pyridoxal phosphate-dependent enzyme [Arthrobacter sp. CAN_C5]MBP2215401.1 aspartate aminotransferase [Arthrobacter sp. CAN_C5]
MNTSVARTPGSRSPVSDRAAAIEGVLPYRLLNKFFTSSPWAKRKNEPDICDLTFGNPHEMPQDAYVEALQEATFPRDDQWFAYKQNTPEAQEAAASSLERLLGVPFRPEDIHLTTGGFAAIALALKAVADPGDEVIYSLPPWFCYEPIVVEAGLVPVKVTVNLETFDLDLDQIAAAITVRTRAVIVNTPNNPTGRIYPAAVLQGLAAVLEEASARIGRRVYVISDEPYNRIVFDGARFHSPVEFYPHTLLAYSYGKTHLSPGERIGYLALPPTLPERDGLVGALAALQLAMGWIYPNAVLQHALPRLERFSIDVASLQRKRDRMVDALREMGYRVSRPEGTFYLFVGSPDPDDEAFVASLADRGVLVMPGALFETPGFFRISLTANEEMLERSLPVFAAAIDRSPSTAD